ncbi:hypothetical protein [Halarchaeum sp. P4]|uniref:hypothetical protein n=1 Tax=Halarchaeum sp. P4 TaxID=3421639 RepID=UPI003EBAB2F2
MTLFETPDGQPVTDGDYVIVLDAHGTVEQANRFDAGERVVDIEPVRDVDEYASGVFERERGNWMTERYADDYPPEEYDYEVRSRLDEDLTERLGL